MTEKRQSKKSAPGDPTRVIPMDTMQRNQDSHPIDMQDLLGDKLRAFYNVVADEPVPDRFEQLLKELEARSTSEKPA